MVEKKKLEQYFDLLKEADEVKSRIKKTERKLYDIEEDGSVIDTVSGGLGGIQHFKVEGFPYGQYSKQKTLLIVRKSKLLELETKIEEFINEIEQFIENVDDSQMRRIISLRFVERLSWDKVADKIGGGNTSDSVKKSFYRFMER